MKFQKTKHFVFTFKTEIYNLRGLESETLAGQLVKVRLVVNANFKHI